MADTINWIPLTMAAKEMGLAQAKISRLVKSGDIRSKKSRLDKRTTFVDFDQVRQLVEEERAILERG